MKIALLVVMAVAVIPMVLPFLSDLICLLSTKREPQGAIPNTSAHLLFLIPAHNEELIIEDCLTALARMIYPAENLRIVLIADNCTDNTSRLGAQHGFEVLDRSDPLMPGKPRAIAWALNQIDLDLFDACVIVDADTTVDPGFAAALSAWMPLRDSAIQAYYGIRNEAENWLTRLAGVLVRCRYEISYPLRQRAGLNCPMTGNGMCIGIELVRNGGWQAFSLTENWELYASYTARGVPIHYARDAVLFSQEAKSLRQGGIQRRRWLAGRIGVLRQWFSAIVGSKVISLHQKLDTIGELGAPSPVVHLGLVILLGGLAMLSGTLGGWFIAAVGAATLLPLLIATAISIAHTPKPLRTVLSFLMLPPYGVWRIATALRTVLAPPERIWIKTERHKEVREKQ